MRRILVRAEASKRVTNADRSWLIWVAKASRKTLWGRHLWGVG